MLNYDHESGGDHSRFEEGDRGDVTESVELASGSNDVILMRYMVVKEMEGSMEVMSLWRILKLANHSNFLCEFFFVRDVRFSNFVAAR